MKRVTLIVLVIALVVLAMLGCGSKAKEGDAAPRGGGRATVAQPPAKGVEVAPTKVAKAKPTVAPKTKPTAKPQPAEKADQLIFGKVMDFGKLDTYRVSHVWAFEWADGTKERMEAFTEFVSQPPAQRMVIKGDDDEEMEIIHIDNVQYMKHDDEWIAMQVSTENVFAQMGWWGGPETFMATSKGDYVGKERVNGLDTKHYHFTQEMLASLSARGTDVVKATADVWVSTKYAVYVKVLMQWEGTDAQKGKGTFSLESNLTDINKPITIKPPEGVAKPEVPDDIPVIDGAEVNIMEQMITLRVKRPQAEVVDWYKAQMLAKGWKAEKSPVPTMLQYKKGNRSANVMMNAEGEYTSIVIMVGEQ